MLGALIEEDVIGRARCIERIAPGRPTRIDPLIQLREMDLKRRAYALSAFRGRPTAIIGHGSRQPVEAHSQFIGHCAAITEADDGDTS